jgi:putative flippase GtrA
VSRLARIARFAAVGVVNTGTYYVFYLLLRTQVTYLVAHVCAFVVAMIGSYFLNCFFTFRTRPRWRTFLLYPLSNLANLVITTIGLRIAVANGGVDQRIAPLLVAVLAIPLTYVVVHYILIGRARPSADVSRLPLKS